MYTKEERKDSYLQSAELIFNKESGYCCEALRRSIGNPDIRFVSVVERFPEFKLFEPKDADGVWWFSGGQANITVRNSRVFALLLCAEMCN
jgi:hypothetical protein